MGQNDLENISRLSGKLSDLIFMLHWISNRFWNMITLTLCDIYKAGYFQAAETHKFGSVVDLNQQISSKLHASFLFTHSV